MVAPFNLRPAKTSPLVYRPRRSRRLVGGNPMALLGAQVGEHPRTCGLLSPDVHVQLGHFPSHPSEEWRIPRLLATQRGRMDRSLELSLVFRIVAEPYRFDPDEFDGLPLHGNSIVYACPHQLHDTDRTATFLLLDLSMAAFESPAIDRLSSETATRRGATQRCRCASDSNSVSICRNRKRGRPFAHQCANHSVGLQHIDLCRLRIDLMDLVFGPASGRRTRFDSLVDGHRYNA